VILSRRNPFTVQYTKETQITELRELRERMGRGREWKRKEREGRKRTVKEARKEQ
jgi:hypothetical protein